jgi:soluble lytic murein transglycosylase-like protein
MSRSLPALLAVSLAALAAGPAAATQVVLFTDGRTMTVETVDREDGVAVLTLEGGGSISVPAERVENWWELESAPGARKGGGEPAAWRARAGSYAELIEAAATKHDLDPALLTAMAEVESAFDAQAVSHKGAQGLLQLMPATAERFGVRDAFDASQNVDGGARYLRWLLERYEGQTELALAGYNAGEAAVDRYQGVPPYRETQNYVIRVLESVNRLGTPASPGR